MTTEQQKYFSGILRNTGFALLAPLASIVFQWIVFEKSLFFGNFTFAVLGFIAGCLFILGGYIHLKEK